jgi:hypothetical protein
LLVVAPGYQPKFVTKVDPATGPVRVALAERRLEGFSAKQKLMGRVVNRTGEPLEGAKIDFDWIETNDGRGCGGGCDEWGVEPLAVSDSNGQFVITAKKPFDRMSVTLDARGLAKGKFAKLASGQEHVLRLAEGATVTGQVMNGNGTVAHTSVGLVSVDRTMENFTGDYEIGTDEKGWFAFPTIPPGREYYVYTLMKDAKRNGGVAAIKKFTAGADGETTKLGDLAVNPAYRIIGHLKLADGSALPAGARMMLGREGAWDTLPNVDVGSDGRFEFDGVPAESVSISPRVKGYCLSLQNPSLDRLNGFSVVGRVEGPMEDLTILLEPGEFRRNDHVANGLDEQPFDKPLRSVEAGPRTTGQRTTKR